MNQEQLFSEINNHLLRDITPSKYITAIIEHPLFMEYPFHMLYKMKKTGQPPQHHPEGNVFQHVLLVIDEAAKVKGKSKNQKVFMWAAMLHDIGKPPTTRIRNKRVTSYDHDRIGAKLAEDFLLYFKQEASFIRAVSALIYYHMQILFVVKNNSRADLAGIKKNVDLEELALLGLCDRLGRKINNKAEEEDNIKRFIEICRG